MVVSPSGSLLRLKSRILEFSFLDSSLHLEDRSVPLEGLRATVRNKNLGSETPGGDPGSPAAMPQGDQIIIVISSDKGTAAYSLPSQKLIHNYNTPVSIF